LSSVIHTKIMKKKLGLFIGRLNPPHTWHIAIIDKALSKNDEVFLLIGTKWITDEKNPLSFEEIRDILHIKYADNWELKIFELRDTPSDEEWVKEIYKTLWKDGSGEFRNINFYWWDFQNDSAYKVIKEYENLFGKYEITYNEVSRKNSFIKYEWQKYDISATNLRKALREWNFELAKNFCDEKIWNKIKSYF
jgi:nicotinamide mononucleotide adenylyltransferase